MTEGNLGGIRAKLGNRYEAKWLVLQLLEVYAGKANALTFEGVDSSYEKFEASVIRDGRNEWHQTKVSRASANWTVNALDDVLIAFDQRLRADASAHCLFVSEDACRDLRHLPSHAKLASDDQQFLSVVNEHEKRAVKELMQLWQVDSQTAWQHLKRCSFRAESLYSIERHIDDLSDRYFENPGSVFPLLRDYLEERFNKKITTEKLRAELCLDSRLSLKPFEADPTILERIEEETDKYLSTYIPFGAGGGTIPRREVDDVVQALLADDRRFGVLLTGVAGSGKSGVVRGILEEVRSRGIPALAFRIDHLLDCKDSRAIGQVLFGREESLVVTLNRVSPAKSLIVIDQVDAVSEVSGRSATARNAVLAILDEAQRAGTVRILLVCREFDLEADRRLKMLSSAEYISRVTVGALTWEVDVEPFLAEKGLVTGSFSNAQKTLLSLPINLTLFLEGSPQDRSFRNRADLFDRLMDAKARAIASIPNVNWSPSEPLYDVVRWMSDKQKLDAPVAILDEFPRAKDVLSSEHLLVDSRGGVGLFHESFFDYLFARQFLIGSQSLLDLLLSDEQHLFRRTQVRQILEALRQQDEVRYLRELRAVLLHTEVRYHIKQSICLWLATVSDPTLQESVIVQELDVGAGALPLLIVNAVDGSVSWFDRLYQKGWWSGQLGAADRKDPVLRMLSRVAAARGDSVACILKGWWSGDRSRAREIVWWFGLVEDFTRDKSLCDLLVDILSSRSGSLSQTALGQHGFFLRHLVKSDITDGARVLKAAYECWFHEHPGEHPFSRDAARGIHEYSLNELATKAPVTFLTGCTAALLQSVGLANARRIAGDLDYEFERRPRSEPFGGQALIAHYRVAFARIVESDPEKALALLKPLDPQLHRLLLHIHLETIVASKGSLAAHLLDLLACDGLDEAGWEGLEWKSFADAAAVSMPHLTSDQRTVVERRILAVAPEAEWALRVLQSGNREAAVYYLNRSGFVRWCILASIDRAFLSSRSLSVLDAAKRKFGAQEVPKEGRRHGGYVRSPIASDKVDKMSDMQLLSAMKKYDGSMRGRHHDFYKGDAHELAQEMQRLAKAQPARLSALLMRLPDNVASTYIDQIVIGLSASEVADITLRDVLVFAFTRNATAHGNFIVQAIRSHPRLGCFPEILDILSWYIRNGEAGDPIGTSDQRETSTASINDLLDRGFRLSVRGIGGSRAAAAEALAKVVWQVPAAADVGWQLVEERAVTEGAIGVRCSLVDPLLPLFNYDKQRCAQLLDVLSRAPAEAPEKDPTNVIDAWTAPLASVWGTELLPFIISQVSDLGEMLINRLLASPNSDFRLIGAWHAIGASFNREDWIERADDLIEQGAVYRRLAAARAAGAFHHRELRERAEAILSRFFNDPDTDTQTQAAEVFQETDPADFEKMKPLAAKFVASGGFLQRSWGLLRALEDAACDTQDLVISAAENMITDLEANGTAGGRHMSELHRLQDLLRRDYNASEGDAELRMKLLDLIDRMLKGGYHGTDRILDAHERW